MKDADARIEQRAGALQFARHFIRQGRQWMAKCEADFVPYTIDQMAEGIINGDISVSRAVADASKDPLAYDALCLVGAWRLSGGAFVSIDLDKFLAGVLRGAKSRPKLAGRPKKNSLRRDFIFSLIDEIGYQYRSFPMTRNDVVSDNNTVCDIVSEALRIEDISPNSYSSVRDIWREWPIRGSVCRPIIGKEE